MRTYYNITLVTKSQLAVCAVLLCANAICGCREQADTTNQTAAEANQKIEGTSSISRTQQHRFADAKRYYRSQDKFLPADFPKFVSIKEADFLADDDEVLGFVVAGRARAYGLQATCYHHVINDLIGEQPIAVTY